MRTKGLRYCVAALSIAAPFAIVNADVILTGDASDADPISAGQNGTDGTIVVNNGSVLSSPSGGAIGSGAGSTGELTVTGPGSALAVGGGPGNSLDAGFDQGTALLIIENGGLLTVDAFDSPDFSDARLNLGRGGNADVTFQSGAQILIRDQNLTGADDGVWVGTSTNFPSDLPGTATLTVRDEGTYLEVNGNLAFLNTGASNTPFTGTTAANGAINIVDGADVLVDGQTSVGIISAGRGGNATGSVNICGSGTTVDVTGSAGLLSIGNNFTSATGSGFGQLNICDNAVANLTGEFGGNFGVGRDESTGIAIIDTGAQLNVDTFASDPGAGGFTLIGDTTSAGGIVIVNDTAILTSRQVLVLENGILGGTGTIVGDVINLGGIVLPGSSPGTLNLQGDLSFLRGTLEIEISPTGIDVINASGDVTFSEGIVRFIFIDGFAPTSGDSIEFIDANSVSGLGDGSQVEFEVAGLLDGFEFDVTTSGGSVGLVAQNDGFPDFIEPNVELRPGEPNDLNPGSNQLFPLAILTTQVAPLFMATDIDPSTVRLGPSNASPVRKKTQVKDVDDDGDADLRLWFRIKRTGISCGDTDAELTGQTYAGTVVATTVSFTTVGCN